MRAHLFILFLFLSQLCSGQTYVTVIGTLHQVSDHINSNDIYQVMKKIKPDVILMEAESSTMSPAGEFLYKSNEVEQTSIKRLLKDYPVIVRPFDYQDRNKYYAEHKSLTKETAFNRSLDSVFNHKLMDSLSMITYQNSNRIESILNALFSNGDLRETNSETMQQLAKLKQEMNYSQTLTLIVNRNKYMQHWAPFWKEYGDFWTFRNQTMVDNIIKYCEEFKNKKIVVLTGATHKYFLVEGLQAREKQEGLILKEFWEYED